MVREVTIHPGVQTWAVSQTFFTKVGRFPSIITCPVISVSLGQAHSNSFRSPTASYYAKILSACNSGILVHSWTIKNRGYEWFNTNRSSPTRHELYSVLVSRSLTVVLHRKVPRCSNTSIRGALVFLFVFVCFCFFFYFFITGSSFSLLSSFPAIFFASR